MVEISVCIATYQRPHGLSRLLSSLERQKDMEFELVIVENDIQEHMRTLVEEFSQRTSIPCTYALEQRRGISYARNKALSMAKGRYIAFIDDDEIATDTWLYHLHSTIRRYPCDGVLGRIVHIYPKGSSGHLNYNNFPDDLPTGSTLDGMATSNTLVKKDALLKYKGPFSASYKNYSGEDAALFKKMVTEGHVFVVCQEAVTYEYIPAVRTTIKWRLERKFSYGNAITNVRIRHKQRVSFFKPLIGLVYHTGVFFLCLPFGKKHSVPHMGEAAYRLGMLFAVIGHRMEYYKTSRSQDIPPQKMKNYINPIK